MCLFVAAIGEKPNAGNAEYQNGDQPQRTLGF